MILTACDGQRRKRPKHHKGASRRGDGQGSRGAGDTSSCDTEGLRAEGQPQRPCGQRCRQECGLWGTEHRAPTALREGSGGALLAPVSSLPLSLVRVHPDRPPGDTENRRGVAWEGHPADARKTPVSLSPTPPTRALRGPYREPGGPRALQSWEHSPASPLAQRPGGWGHGDPGGSQSQHVREGTPPSPACPRGRGRP